MFFTKDDDCIVCDPKGEYLKRNRKGEERMLEKCLEKCVCCGSDKMVKNGRLLQGLSVECESCGLMLSVPCQISDERTGISDYYREYYTIPKYHLWLKEEMREVYPFDSDSKVIREMIYSGEAVLLESAQKNSTEGSELFEGDIVRVTGLVAGHKLYEEVCVIRKSKKFVGLVFYSMETEMEYVIFHDDLDNVCEYLGNIYENPELV